MGRRKAHQFLHRVDIDVRALAQFELRLVLFQFEMSKPMVVHELDNFFDILEFHRVTQLASGWLIPVLESQHSRLSTQMREKSTSAPILGTRAWVSIGFDGAPARVSSHPPGVFPFFNQFPELLRLAQRFILTQGQLGPKEEILERIFRQDTMHQH